MGVVGCIVPYLTLVKSGIPQVFYGEITFCMGHPREQYDIYSSNIAVSISEYIIRDIVLESSRSKHTDDDDTEN
jgi:hypothetical protein